MFFVNLVIFFAWMGMLNWYPIYNQQVKGFSPEIAGFLFAIIMSGGLLFNQLSVIYLISDKPIIHHDASYSISRHTIINMQFTNVISHDFHCLSIWVDKNYLCYYFLCFLVKKHVSYWHLNFIYQEFPVKQYKKNSDQLQ